MFSVFCFCSYIEVIINAKKYMYVYLKLKVLTDKNKFSVFLLLNKKYIKYNKFKVENNNKTTTRENENQSCLNSYHWILSLFLYVSFVISLMLFFLSCLFKKEDFIVDDDVIFTTAINSLDLKMEAVVVV